MADVILKLVIDGKEFDAKIKDADMQIGGLKKGIQKHSADMTTSLKSVASAMGLAFGAATVMNFMKQSIEAFAKQEAALKRLSTALGNTTKGLEEYASKLQSITTYGDENIIDAMALFAAFTKDEEQIKKLTKATLDLAAAKSIDLKSAADMVAKSFGSETNALKRIGIEVEGVAGSNKRLEMLVRNVSILYEGQASAALDTYTGKVQHLRNEVGDLSEVIGKVLVDSIYGAVDALTALGQAGADWLNQMTTNAMIEGIIKAQTNPSEYVREAMNKALSDIKTKSKNEIKNLLNLTIAQLKAMEKMNSMTLDDKNTMDQLKVKIQIYESYFSKEKKDTTVKEIKKAGNALAELEATARRFQHSTGKRGITGLLFPSEQEPGAKGGTAPIKEMSETMKQSMGVINDTTDAMWRNLIIGGRQAVNEWDAIWLAFRNSALQRIGEIVQDQIWQWLLGTLFSFIPGVGGVAGAAAQAVTGTPSGMAGGLSKMNVVVEGKIEGENIYLSNKRVTQRKSDNRL